jgi:hypothetical protein
MGLLKENCKCCKRPLKDVISQLNGFGPVCMGIPRCSKCHKAVEKGVTCWNIWSKCGRHGSPDGSVNPMNGLWFWASSLCCSAEIVNVEEIYDGQIREMHNGEHSDMQSEYWSRGNPNY